MPENPPPTDDKAVPDTDAGTMPSGPEEKPAAGAGAAAEGGGVAGDVGATAAPVPLAESAPSVASAPEPATAAALDAAVEPAADPAQAPPTPAIAELAPAACAARLAELFPAVFTPGVAKPLKLRIQSDIQQQAPGIFTKKTLSIFLHRHTTSTAYLKALVASPSRIDLGGEPAGEVADEHRVAAATELERRRALHDARRAAERQAQREAQREGQAQRVARGRPAGELPGAPPGEAPADGTQPVQEEARRSGPRGGERDRPPFARRESNQKGRGPRGEARGTAHRVAPQNAPSGRNRPADDRARPGRGADAPLQRGHDGDPPAQRGHGAEDPLRAEPTFDDPVRRERALLLRAYESSTLTRRNFCVLKRISEAELDTLLSQARQDAGERSASQPAQDVPAQAARPRHGESGQDGRGPRPVQGTPSPSRPRGARKP